MKPRLSKSAIQLREQIDDSFADRDRTSDGWIGDSRHSARKSDHNPDVQGWVRAIDVDRDLAGKKGKDGRIASSKKAWAWRPYDGINKHNHHAHVSFTPKGDEDSSFFNIPMIGGK